FPGKRSGEAESSRESQGLDRNLPSVSESLDFSGMKNPRLRFWRSFGNEPLRSPKVWAAAFLQGFFRPSWKRAVVPFGKPRKALRSPRSSRQRLDRGFAKPGCLMTEIAIQRASSISPLPLG